MNERNRRTDISVKPVWKSAFPYRSCCILTPLTVQLRTVQTVCPPKHRTEPITTPLNSKSRPRLRAPKTDRNTQHGCSLLSASRLARFGALASRHKSAPHAGNTHGFKSEPLHTAIPRNSTPLTTPKKLTVLPCVNNQPQTLATLTPLFIPRNQYP